MLGRMAPVRVVGVPVAIVRPVHPRVVAVDVDVEVVSAPVGPAPAPVVRIDRPRGAPEDPGRVSPAQRHLRVAPDRPRVPVPRPVRGRPPRAVDDLRVVHGHVDVLRLRRLDDDRPVLDDDVLLRRRLQVAGLLRALAQRLHGAHHGRLVGEERVAQALRPLELGVHHVEHLRERAQRQHARVPGLALQRAVERLAREVAVGLDEARGLDDLERIRGRHQHLRQELVRIERDRRQQRVEQVLRHRRGGRLRAPAVCDAVCAGADTGAGEHAQRDQQRDPAEAVHGVLRSAARSRPRTSSRVDVDSTPDGRIG